MALSQTAPAGFTASAAAFGTPMYMAPEQIAMNAPVDHRADIYSVGVLGYELLTGRPPLTTSLAATPALAELLTKCLETRPEDRFQSADELVQRLERLAFPPDVSRPQSRSRRGALIFAAAIAASTLAIFAWHSVRRRTPEPVVDV